MIPEKTEREEKGKEKNVEMIPEKAKKGEKGKEKKIMLEN